MPRVSASRSVGTAFGVGTSSSRARAARSAAMAPSSSLAKMSIAVDDAPFNAEATTGQSVLIDAAASGGAAADDLAIAIDKIEKVEPERRATVGPASRAMPASPSELATSRNRRGEPERLDLLAGCLEDARHILMGDGEVAIDLRNQRGVEFVVPAHDGDAEQQRQDHQRRQQGDRKQAETDRPAGNRHHRAFGPPSIPQHEFAIDGLARDAEPARGLVRCRRFPSAPP